MKKLILKSSLIFVIFLISLTGISQIVYTYPPIPYADEEVIVYFNAEDTSLEGYSGNVYAHTGITVDGNQWQYVVGSWGNNSTQPQLTNIGTDLYQLDIEPTIREYYGASLSEYISEMCFVFRNSDATTQTVPDIYIEVFEPIINVIITQPDVNPLFVNPGENLTIEAEAIEAQEISLYVDNILIVTVPGNSLSETITCSSTPDTKQQIKVIAINGAQEASDSTNYYVRGETLIEALPNGVKDGINYIDNQTVTLVLHAPYKSTIFIYGEFNDWEIGPEVKLKRNLSDPQNFDTRYWITITGLTPNEEYAFQYLIDEELYVAEPYADKILDPWNDLWIEEETYPNLKPYPEDKTEGIVSVLETGQAPYQWQNTNFDAPPVEKLVVYELLMRDFTHAHDFQTMKDTINYFKRLGTNAIELMPVNEFEGNLSWGYNPSFYFAPDKYYGPKNDMKAFIDECHANGIAVIMDIVLNHAFGQCVLAQMYWDSQNNRPASNNPWFNTVSPNPDYSWGNDFNHESSATKAFVDNVNRYWISEYKVDGFRYDFSKGFTNTPGNGLDYDAARINVLKRMADTIWANNPDTYVILEHFTDNSEEKELANYGMAIWGNLNFNYNEATMGWNVNSDFSWISYLLRNYNDPCLMGYMESHDEERLMAKNINYGNSGPGYNIQDTTTALKRMELAGVFFFTIPGPKMMWQFGELGYDYHINYPGELGGNDHRMDPKPIRWDYTQDESRDHLFKVFSRLIKLRINEEAFSTDDFTLSVSGSMKKIHLNHNTMNVTILGNFDVYEGDILPAFQHTGYWYDYFAQDSILVNNVNQQINLEAGEYKVYTDVFLGGIYTSKEEQRILSNTQLSIYPNPASDLVNIKSDYVIESVCIYSISGQMILNQSTSGNKTEINISGFEHGMYFVKIFSNNNIITRKLVIE